MTDARQRLWALCLDTAPSPRPPWAYDVPATGEPAERSERVLREPPVELLSAGLGPQRSPTAGTKLARLGSFAPMEDTDDRTPKESL